MEPPDKSTAMQTFRSAEEEEGVNGDWRAGEPPGWKGGFHCGGFIRCGAIRVIRG